VGAAPRQCAAALGCGVRECAMSWNTSHIQFDGRILDFENLMGGHAGQL